MRPAQLLDLAEVLGSDWLNTMSTALQTVESLLNREAQQHGGMREEPQSVPHWREGGVHLPTPQEVRRSATEILVKILDHPSLAAGGKSVTEEVMPFWHAIWRLDQQNARRVAMEAQDSIMRTELLESAGPLVFTMLGLVWRKDIQLERLLAHLEKALSSQPGAGCPGRRDARFGASWWRLASIVSGGLPETSMVRWAC
jgi:hypothetical protein